MKVAIKVPKAFANAAFVYLENNRLSVGAILPLCSSASASADGTYAYISLNIDKTIQKAEYYDGAVYQPATSFFVLDNQVIETFGSIQPDVSVVTFKKGMTYLIPFSGGFGTVNIIPNNLTIPFGGSAPASGVDNLFATHYRFDCPEDTDLMNSVSVSNCITCVFKGSAVVEVQTVKEQRKLAEQITYGVAIGNQKAIDMINSMS